MTETKGYKKERKQKEEMWKKRKGCNLILFFFTWSFKLIISNQWTDQPPTMRRKLNFRPGWMRSVPVSRGLASTEMLSCKVRRTSIYKNQVCPGTMIGTVNMLLYSYVVSIAFHFYKWKNWGSKIPCYMMEARIKAR